MRRSPFRIKHSQFTETLFLWFARRSRVDWGGWTLCWLQEDDEVDVTRERNCIREGGGGKGRRVGRGGRGKGARRKRRSSRWRSKREASQYEWVSNSWFNRWLDDFNQEPMRIFDSTICKFFADSNNPVFFLIYIGIFFESTPHAFLLIKYIIRHFLRYYVLSLIFCFLRIVKRKILKDYFFFV